jgi:hypothetical protein
VAVDRLAHPGDHRLVGAVTNAKIEARRDSCITVMGEFARDLARPFIPARHVVDHHNAGMRPGIRRVRIIGITAIAAMAAIRCHPRLYVPKRHIGPPSKCRGSLGTEARQKQADIQPHSCSRLDIARALSRPCATG